MKQDETVSATDLLLSNVAELNALVALLVRKSQVTEAELLHEVQAMKERMHTDERTGSA